MPINPVMPLDSPCSSSRRQVVPRRNPPPKKLSMAGIPIEMTFFGSGIIRCPPVRVAQANIGYQVNNDFSIAYFFFELMDINSDNMVD